MADNPLKHSELVVNDGAIDELIEKLEKLNTQMDSVKGQAAKVEVSMEKVNSATSEQREVIGETVVKADKLVKAQQNLEFSYSETAKELAVLKKEQQQQNQVTKLQTALAKSAEGSYDKLSAQYSLNKIQLNGMTKEQREATKSGQKLETQTRQIFEEMNRLQKATGKASLQVGQYDRFMSGAVKTGAKFAAGFTAALLAIQGITRGITRAVETFRRFQDTNATLNSILGKTSELTAELRTQQLELGKSTEFSASQVASAQTELARLGKTQEEIIAMTPGILSAATALGTDLASSAALVAGQLNAFGLEASESQRVSDTLTKSTQISALNFSKLETALGIVSPAAKAVNVTLEEQLAILGSAVDANIDAGTAATALRNIFIDLGDKGISWSEAMEQINSSTNSLNTANELFGKRGAVVAAVIANNTEKIDANTASLRQAAGTAESFANNQLDTLTGDIKLLTSAWEGFLLGIEKGDGLIARFVRGSIQTLTVLLGKLTPEIENQTSSLELQRQEFNALMIVLQDLNPEEDEARKIISKLNTEYAEYLPFLISEKTTKEELAQVQKKVNEEILNTIVLRQQEQELQNISETQIAFANKILELQREQGKLTNENTQLLQKEFTTRAESAKDASIIQFNQNRIDQIDEEVIGLRNLISGGTRLTETIRERAEALKVILGLGNSEIQQNSSIADSISQANNSIESIEVKPKKVEVDLSEADIVIPENLASVQIFDPIKFNLSDEQKEQMMNSVNTIKNAFLSINQSRLDALYQALDISNREMDEARSNLEDQLALRAAGEQADVQGAIDTLNRKKQINKKTIAEQRKAQRTQQRIQEAESISSIIAASANIFKGWSTIPFVGQILGAAAVGAMITAFVASKAQANRVSKFGSGGDFQIQGGSHSSGNDVSFGVHGGTEMRAEGGEQAAIFSRKSVRRYGRGKISEIVKTINNGEFQHKYANSFSGSSQLIAVANESRHNSDTEKIMDENVKLRQELKDVVKSIPQPIHEWDDKGYKKHIRTGNTIERNVKQRNSYG